MANPVVLVVDDSIDDLALIRLAFRKLALKVDLRAAEGGAQAIAYLTGTGEFHDRALHPLPRLVLLDLKMPRVNGFDVLAALQESEVRHQTAIVVLSTSQLPEEVQRALSLGALAFHTKPVDLDQFHSLLERICTSFCLTKGEAIAQTNV